MKVTLAYIVVLALAAGLISCNNQKDTHKITKAKEISHNLKLGSGKVQRYHFSSDYVDARNVDIWLPENYSSDQKYAILYMHDGQMLFDSTKTWNHQEWEVDEIAAKLIKNGTIQPTIVVGIWNNDKKRPDEFFPEKAFEKLNPSAKKKMLNVMDDKPIADEYLKFMVKELKPFVDNTFSTYSDRKHTFVMGSSFGGLISLYAISEYPDVFGGAACMSSHWTGTFEANEAIPNALNKYLKEHMPSPDSHKIYFDHGTKTLDAKYLPYQKMIDQTMKAGGYSGNHFMSRTFPGADHSEHSWSKRLNIPLKFLLSN